MFISPEDLWESLGVASGKPVGEVMSTWTKQQGYPVLTVDAKQVWGPFVLAMATTPPPVLGDCRRMASVV